MVYRQSLSTPHAHTCALSRLNVKNPESVNRAEAALLQ